MVTGDFPITAAAIARDVGILSGGVGASHTVADLPRDTPLAEIPSYQPTLPNRERRGIVLSGSDLMAMSDSQWKWMLAYQEHVFARTTPEQKLRMRVLVRVGVADLAASAPSRPRAASSAAPATASTTRRR